MTHRRGAEDTESRGFDQRTLRTLRTRRLGGEFFLSLGCGSAALVSLAQILQRLQCFRIVGGEGKDFAILLFRFVNLA